MEDWQSIRDVVPLEGMAKALIGQDPASGQAVDELDAGAWEDWCIDSLPIRV